MRGEILRQNNEAENIAVEPEPVAEVEKSTDRNRKFELMKKSHEQALVAFKLEQMACRGASMDEMEGTVEKMLKRRARTWWIISEYVEGMKDADYDMEKILKSAEGALEPGGEPITSETLGKFIFAARAGKFPPDGKVTFEKQEAYFVMTFENPNDYACAYDGKSNANSGASRLSGGSFHDSIKLELDGHKLLTPVLMVKESEYAESVITHERQHFINHRLFKKFEWTERHKLVDDIKGRGVKDEVLAYIRDGSAGSRIRTALSGELYQHLFNETPEEKKEETIAIIDKVSSFIDENKGFLNSEESRAVLVYQLAGIPLERFPAWLDAFEEYYTERAKIMAPFMDSKGINSSIYDKNFPTKQANQAVERMADLEDEMGELAHDARELAYSLETSDSDTRKKVKKIFKNYQGLLDQAGKDAKFLMRDGALMPSAETSELREVYAEFGKKGETESTKKVQQAVLEAVKNFPQDQIDEISEKISDPEGGYGLLKNLEKTIKDAVANEIGKKTMHISFSTSAWKPNSFKARVEFESSEEDRKNLIGKIIMHLNFHSRKFELFC